MGDVALTSITWGKGVEEIGDGTFYLCKNLTEISFPSSLKKIGDAVFSPCSKLQEIYLPATLENIPVNAFWIKDGANVYVKEGSWADIHYSEFVDKDAISEDLIYINNYY